MMRARLPYFTICLLLITSQWSSLFAHQDTVIRLEGTKLIGLPAHYSPAEFDLESFRLRIGAHVMEFSPLLKSFFIRQPYDLQVSASWYHDSDSGLPPYLALHILPKGRDYSYGVLLALDTLRLIEVSIELRGFDATVQGWPNSQRLTIALSDFQKKQIAESIRDVR